MCAHFPSKIGKGFFYFFKFVVLGVCAKLRPLLKTLVCALVKVIPTRFTMLSIGLACLTILRCRIFCSEFLLWLFPLLILRFCPANLRSDDMLRCCVIVSEVLPVSPIIEVPYRYVVLHLCDEGVIYEQPLFGQSKEREKNERIETTNKSSYKQSSVF